MSSSGIEHKLRVFISSKCGGKYTIARKTLKKLLETTGLVEAYAFETEPASSEDTRSAYLEYVDNSNLCIFLVDNADGAPPAVLSEEKRAKDKQLRLLYLFCDEIKKESTPMQNEIKVSMSQKYFVVHEFSDIVSAAYDSLMQDVITVYKRKEGPFSSNNAGDIEVQDSKSLNNETYSLLTSSFSEFPHVYRELTKHLIPINPLKKTEEPTLLERLLSDQLLSVLFLKQFEETVIDGIGSEVIRENSGEMLNVLKLRYQAQKHYFCSHYSECMEFLQKAIIRAIEAKSIPTWFANDIAIDIRHVQSRIAEQNNYKDYDNLGQQYIDKSGEPVYFPYLDRQVGNMQTEITKYYYSILNTSPYTTNYGGLEKMFVQLTNAFCVAQLHGSIIQTIITRDRLISIYSMLCTLYEDHDSVVEYVRLLVINRDAKKLDSLIRTYNQSIDILNGKDIDDILRSVDRICDADHRIMSKYLLASRLGYYMSDTAYTSLYEELIDYAMSWLCNDKRIMNLGSYIFDFFKQNTYRVKSKNTIDFVFKVFKQGLKCYYTDCFKVLQNVDFELLGQTEQSIANSFKSFLVDITKNEDRQVLDQFYESTVIRFCKNGGESYEDLEAEIAEKLPDFYNHTFLLEMAVQREQDLSDYINLYLAEARSRNITQGKNGAYFGYSYESLDVVYSILKTKEITLNEKLLQSIVNVGIETLASEKQTIQAKRSALKLLQFLYFRYRSQDDIWRETSKQMIDNMPTFSVGNEIGVFSKDTNAILSFQYSLFVCVCFIPRYEELLEVLYSADPSASYSVIQHLSIIADFLEDADGHLQNETLVSTFMFYSVFMSQHKERDIKYRAAICLIELTKYTNTRRLALIHLSRIMDSASQDAKIAILTRLNKIQIDEDDSYLRQIENKGKADSNYLVRYVATRDYSK